MIFSAREEGFNRALHSQCHGCSLPPSKCTSVAAVSKFYCLGKLANGGENSQPASPAIKRLPNRRQRYTHELREYRLMQSQDGAPFSQIEVTSGLSSLHRRRIEWNHRSTTSRCMILFPKFTPDRKSVLGCQTAEDEFADSEELTADSVIAIDIAGTKKAVGVKSPNANQRYDYC
jgi:hypothetical protein